MPIHKGSLLHQIALKAGSNSSFWPGSSTKPRWAPMLAMRPLIPVPGDDVEEDDQQGGQEGHDAEAHEAGQGRPQVGKEVGRPRRGQEIEAGEERQHVEQDGLLHLDAEAEYEPGRQEQRQARPLGPAHREQRQIEAQRAKLLRKTSELEAMPPSARLKRI